MITKNKIIEAQKKWGDGIVKMGSLMDNKSDCIDFTTSFLNTMYDFKNGKVLFKPTKASKEQFRTEFDMAFSYFIGGENSYCKEDDGFAMKPWIKVEFSNSGFIIDEKRAIAMGNYFFTDSNGNTVKVEYTFGYKFLNNNLVIDLHHSSLPFAS